MSTPLPVSFVCSPIPSTFIGNPAQFAQELTARLSLVAPDQLTFFATGSTAPTSNVGPWIKNGVEWYVWSAATGGYVPITLDPASLQYTASQVAPDPTIYTFWIKLDSTGNPLGIYYYFNNNWIDIYSQVFSLYSTTEQMLQLLSATQTSYPGRVGQTNSYQIAINTNSQVVPWDTVLFDPRSCFNLTGNQYVAQTGGIYHVDSTVQVDNGYPIGSNLGNAAAMEFSYRTAVNGNPTGTNNLWFGNAVNSPAGNRWYPALSGLVYLNAGDTLEIWLSADDDVNTGSLTISNGSFCVHMVNS